MLKGKKLVTSKINLMSKHEAISRYNLIIKKLRKHPATFEEIADYLSFESELQEYNFNISKRTFQRDLNDIRSVYNIDIRYDFSRRVYHIDYEDQPEVYERILEAFDTFNALNLSDRLSTYIQFEKRKPQGTEHLYGLLHAIRNNFQINVLYEKYWTDEFTQRVLEPYILKEFKNRWYVLAKDQKDARIKIFALDRIKDYDITKKRFQPPGDFNVNEYFRYCFGIISPNENRPHNIILSIEPTQGKYIKSLPLHETQKILIDNDKELRIQLTLYITMDLIIELLSMGDSVKVIKPTSLKNQLIKTYKKALEQYHEF